MPTSTPSIQFTHEVEENGLLPFLDTEITYHTDGSQSTKVHRSQPILTNNFTSPLAHKVAVVWTLYQRAEHLCTFADDKTEEE